MVVITPRYRRRPDALWRRSLDAVVILPVGGPETVTLAGTGVDLWDLLVTPASLGALAKGLARHYDADPAAVEADLAPIVDELVRLGALENCQ